MSYRLSAEAARDLISLTEYGIETFGEATARRYHDGLHRAFELIADMPAIGRHDPDHPGFRRFFHGRHVIIYRVEDAGVLIARLLHAAMESARHGVGDGD